jgi:hypothetical protein
MNTRCMMGLLVVALCLPLGACSRERSASPDRPTALALTRTLTSKEDATVSAKGVLRVVEDVPMIDTWNFGAFPQPTSGPASQTASLVLSMPTSNSKYFESASISRGYGFAYPAAKRGPVRTTRIRAIGPSVIPSPDITIAVADDSYLTAKVLTFATDQYDVVFVANALRPIRFQLNSSTKYVDLKPGEAYKIDSESSGRNNAYVAYPKNAKDGAEFTPLFEHIVKTTGVSFFSDDQK